MYKKIFLTAFIVYSTFFVVQFWYAQVYNPNLCFINWDTINNGQTTTVYQQYQVPYWSNCNSIQETFSCTQWVLIWTNPSSQPSNYPYWQCSVAAPVSCSLWNIYWQQTVIPHWAYATWYKDDIVEPGVPCEAIWTAGNAWLLQCNNWSLLSASWRIINAADYKYPSCSNRAIKDCEFNWQIIQHGFSVTWYVVPFPSIWQQCSSQKRSCFDWVLSWSYQFSSCSDTPAQCWEATSWSLYHPTAPTINLCSGWYLLWSVWIAITWQMGTWTQRQWTCWWYWLSTTQCYWNLLVTNTWQTACWVLPTYQWYLHALDNRLCTLWYSSWFATTATWRNRSCIYQNTSAYWCKALNDIIPTWTISYNPSTATVWTVTATLSNINLPWTTIFNNNWSNTYIFSWNGKFSYMLSVDWKIGRVEAVVDWISNRISIFEQLLDNYKSNICNQYNFYYQDIDKNKYKLDILTMKNLCIMEGYQFWLKNLFLADKPLTRREALVTLKKVSELLWDYHYIVEEPSNYKYWWVNDSNVLFPFVKWWEDVELMSFFKHLKNWNNVLIDRESSITRKELINMFNHTLFIHNLHEELNLRLFKEIQFADGQTITRWERAFILRRIIESYEHMPIWNDYRLLKLLRDRIKNDTLEEQLSMLQKVNKLISKMPQETLSNLWLTKWRLLTDIQAVILNKFPKRLEKVDITIDTIREKLRYMKQPEYIIDLDFSDFMLDYIDDDYHDIYNH